MNRNVKLALFFTFFQAACDGIWGTSVLSAYLQGLGGSNEKVGLAEGLQGTVQASVALPFGHLADRLGRARILKIATFAGVLASVCFGIALQLGRTQLSLHQEYVFATASLCVVGVYYGCWSAPLQAIFHNSLTTQERPAQTTYMYALRVLGSSTGPLMGLIVFKNIGDDWSLSSLRTVMQIGTGLGCIPVILLCFFSERRSLGEASEIIVRLPSSNSASSASSSCPLSDQGNSVNGNSATPYATALAQEPELSAEEQARQKIPLICAVADVFFGLASGMTVKFFPLFFKDETGLSPTSVNLIFILTPACLAISSIVLQRWSKVMGRVQVTLLSKGIGIGLLYLMAFMGTGYDKKTEFPPLWQKEFVIVPIYMLRTVLMNATAPLQKSILMDFCSKDTRGRWNSIESITQFGWSGSALLGGIISDKWGYGASFIATAVMQSIGWLLLLRLLPIVPIEHPQITPAVATPSSLEERLLDAESLEQAEENDAETRR